MMKKTLFSVLTVLFVCCFASAGITMTETAPGVFESGDIDDGNYIVTLDLQSDKGDAAVSVYGESRRLFFENVKLKKKRPVTLRFCINKRDTIIRGDKPGKVRIKDNERAKPNWDTKLTVHVAGADKVCRNITVEPAPATVPTVFLCGNSTVVDQDYDPWASWGQMVTRWFGPDVCFANYAESGESASNFIGVKRWDKILSQIKPGDYVMIEFGHNDQKQKWPGAGAYYNFSTALKTMIDQTRAAGATPVLITPTCRRFFDDNGKIKATHGDYPEAMRKVAEREGVALIDLQNYTKQFYEALGVEGSKRAFVHYPANTYPGQDKALADNTHFNPYGAYEIAKMVIEGMKADDLPVLQYLLPEYGAFDPASPDDPEAFVWISLSDVNTVKPDGN